MRRMGSRGYTKYFQQLSLQELLDFNSNDMNLMQLLPNYSKLGEEKDYVMTILTIMIKEEIEHRIHHSW